jgi:hypothetical protein
MHNVQQHLVFSLFHFLPYQKLVNTDLTFVVMGPLSIYCLLAKVSSLKVIYLRCVINQYVSHDSTHTTPQYNQSCNKLWLVPSYHQALSLQEPSIKTLTARSHEI